MTPKGEARKAVRELIRDAEMRMYSSSYESECLAKLKVIRRGLYA
jgi:hypothetical protein